MISVQGDDDIACRLRKPAFVSPAVTAMELADYVCPHFTRNLGSPVG